MHKLIVRQLAEAIIARRSGSRRSSGEKVRADSSEEFLISWTSPVITLGRRANTANILVNRDELRRRGFEVPRGHARRGR